VGWRAREITIAASLALHAAIGVAALSAAHEKQARRATEVSLAEQKKPEKPPEKKPEPPKPPPVPPKPRPVTPKALAPAPAPVPVAAPAATPAVTAPVATDIAMSNDTGMDLGTGHRPHDEVKPGTPAAAKPTPTPAAARPTAPRPEQRTEVHEDAGACAEPAGKPEPTMKTDIAYTDEARAAGIEGRLVLKVTVDADGNVTDVKVVNGVDAALDAAAIQTVKTWRFKPAMACGKPVAGGVYTLARRFVLGD